MSTLKNFIRSIIPDKLLHAYRENKKNKQRKSIQEQADKGEGLILDQLIKELRTCGIKEGDSVLVHTSFSKIGFVEGGPKTVVDGLLSVIGVSGNLLMPSSPNAGYQLNYIQKIREFDVRNEPSKMGAITEYFRKIPGVKRSESPTEPVCCFGPKADWFTSGHLGELTPYTENSPFARLAEANGKILYIGVTLDNAGTSLHILEDTVSDFKYPVYYPEVFHVLVKQLDETLVPVQVKVHNPEQSSKRKCDELLPLFESKGVMKRSTIGKAKTLIFDASKMLEVMIDEYHSNGVTMYTPQGDI
ncbi:AAC(3) family N-acetyltransferase [Fluviicola taffensis]|uniref:Aminoglycoside N(3)-acetyltransferase n=1 Tax=Fluviicola taffensis (strain DSM 16823 / NCIMB 13979 / RW262) TaxID=755732 RepID=F2I9F5_FLUTR|nr:AAC(3) family N-acetyltransferase [Fluviicola taffensis]AEA45136.1 aminoglycoside 3-N-acetyltransferase [Fluviicola taffensis DSM 16823]